jgi:hypothetical protein
VTKLRVKVEISIYMYCIKGNIRPVLFSPILPSLSVCEFKAGRIYQDRTLSLILIFFKDNSLLIRNRTTPNEAFIIRHVPHIFKCLFWVARAIFQLYGDCHRWYDCKFNLCLALKALRSWGPFACHIYCERDVRFKVMSERPVILTSECLVVLLAKEQWLSHSVF